jgi:hypothetical protein
VRILVDHQLEAFCQKGLQHEVSGRQRGAVRNLADHVEQVGTEPAWTAGNIVRDPEASLAAFRSHGKRWDIEEVELRGSQIELLAGQVVGAARFDGRSGRRTV